MVRSLSLILLSFVGLAVCHGNQGNHLSLGLVKQAFNDASIPSTLSINFNPKALLEVTFPQPSGKSITLHPGIHLPINATAGPPSFSTVGNIGEGPFVVVAVDPDAPPPFQNEIRHFLGANFFHNSGPHAGLLVNKTSAISKFLQPAPPPGLAHRYIFLLFEQPSEFNSQTLVTPNTSVEGFHISMFAAATGLGDPIAGTFMLVRNTTTT